MPTFKYAKLVRDNIPGWHRESGHTVNGRQLTGKELLEALIEKLHEETDEVSGAMSRNELIEEIGDVQQIINDILATQNIAQSELEQSIQKKTGRKGGFLRGEYIESVVIPDENDEWAQYCRRSPEKYPEIR
jgi:predicted house-cleaning noncanonical NTP pyrophosphatase (MazG superfamily)